MVGGAGGGIVGGGAGNVVVGVGTVVLEGGCVVVDTGLVLVGTAVETTTTVVAVGACRGAEVPLAGSGPEHAPRASIARSVATGAGLIGPLLLISWPAHRS